MYDYLSRYVEGVKILSPDSIKKEDLNLLPLSWREILHASPRDRIDLTLSMWKPFAYELQKLFAYLKYHLEAVELVKSSRGICLIYTIRAVDGSLMYYEGRPPTGIVEDDKQSLWDEIPGSLKKFYKELHNGWDYFASNSMGLMRREDVFVLDSLEWGILDTLDTTMPVRLDQTLAFFNNGMGDYVCIEKKNNGVVSHIWFHDTEPNLDIDFWAVVDTWICLGLEG